MASKKSFKPPKKLKDDFARKTVSLTDEQYDELFNAVIHPSQKTFDTKSPTTASSPGNQAKSPKESASVENSQSSQKEKQKLTQQLAKNTESSTISTIHSEDFIKNAVFSTPEIKKPRSYREALQNLQNLKKNNLLPESLNSSISDVIEDCPYSQQPPHLTRRERLQWLQDRRGTGLYVKCDHSNCEKWRYLNIADPVDVPHQWFCNMNPDKAFASCSIPEKLIPLHIEEDLIHNCYTAGSIVWAKMVGYPWWPAMVDDCPDSEQYYWVNNELYDVPNWYHVVFFDDGDVSRQWVLVKDLKSFKHSPNLDKKYKIKQNYKSRLAVAKTKANTALKLDIKDRLKQFSFLSLWKGEIPEFNDSDLEDSDLEENDPNFERVIKRKIIQRRKALALSQESSSSEMIRKSNTKTKKKIKKPKKINENSAKDTSVSSITTIQSRRMSNNSGKNSANKTHTPTKSKEINTTNCLSQKSHESSNYSCDKIQTRRMSRNNSYNSEDTNKIETLKKVDKKSKAKKDNKKIVSRRHTLSVDVDLNKSDPNLKLEKPKISRRKSEATIKEEGKNAPNLVDEEFIKEVTTRCNDLKNSGNMKLNKYDSSFKEDGNKSLFSSDNVKIPLKSQNKKSFSSEEKSKKVNEDSKRRKIIDEISAPPKLDTKIKKKKSFMPPTKKNMDASTASSSSSNIPELLFE